MSYVTTRDLVGAARWNTVAFTTYALSLSFFEAVVLDLLVRRRSAAPLLVADVDGVRSALSEYGARRVGRDYELEPVSVAGGVFHPKVTVLADAEDAHLVVGSGNLTFGGWAGNLECVEHLHPSFAADAFADAEDFFLALAISPRLQHDALVKFETLSTRLGLAAAAGPRHGGVRLLHSLADPLADQISAISSELGGAKRVVVTAPYWDRDGGAVADLCRAIGVDHAYAHVHPYGLVRAGSAENYPWAATFKLDPVEVHPVSEAAAKRPMHAKIFEVVCARGRLLVSGSANATRKALGAGGNVEAVVLRMSREPHVGWRLEPSATLPLRRETETEEEGEENGQVLVLRAHLAGDLVSGLVLGEFPPGPAHAFQVSVDGAQEIGVADVNGRGGFDFEAASLELEAWKTGRLVLRLKSGTRIAEGFVAFRDLQEVRRRAGQSAARLLAVMAHVDAPEDALALMSWFHENPDALSQNSRIGGGSGDGPVRAADTVTNPAALLRPNEVRPSHAGSTSTVAAGWQRFLSRLFASLAEPRRPFSEPGDDAEDETKRRPEDTTRIERQRQKEADRRARWSGKALQVFDTVFERALSGAQLGSDFSGLFALTQYVCHRLTPEQWKVRDYLSRLLDGFLIGRSPASSAAAAAAVVACAALEPDPISAARRARGRLLKAGWDVAGLAPDLEVASGFLDALGLEPDLHLIWRAIGLARTIPEEVRAYRHALETGAPQPDLQLLPAREEWPLLAAAFGAEPHHQQVRFVEAKARRCPCSTTALPDGERHSLASSKIARAPCGHILLCEAD